MLSQGGGGTGGASKVFIYLRGRDERTSATESREDRAPRRAARRQQTNYATKQSITSKDKNVASSTPLESNATSTRSF